MRRGINKKIITCLLLIALITVPIAGCVGGGNLPPVADFTYEIDPLPSPFYNLIFTDKSTDADGSIVSWAWNFGDGNTSTNQNPSHSFPAPTTYTVTLTVTDDEGASSTCTATVTVSSPPAGIDKDGAIAILVGKIIKPADAYKRISAFMLSQPLQNGDVVTSESGQSYPINTDTWFIFIDDNPEAFYAHATRYVFMDARTGTYDIANETWPPMINNFSMWDTQNLGRGNLIELYSILDSPVPISGSTSQAPTGDYGDAPDGQDAYYGISGRYPTLYNTTNSQFNRPGVHTLNIGGETLGVNVSAEVDATDPNDPDGVPNLVDADSDERTFVIVEGTKAKLAFTVTVSPNAPNVTRYANALIDFDQSGNWSAGAYGTEWVVVNLVVNVAPGSSETVITPWFPWGNKTVLPSPVWMRLLLAREKVDQALFANVGGWDGSGRFEYGEIEDHFAFLIDNPPPPDGDGDGNGNGNGPPPPGPKKGPCGYDINYYVLIINCGDKYKHIAQGIPIAQAASSSMASVAQSQGYTSVGNLGPGSNSLADLGVAFDNLAAAVKCGDHVLIYICGHSGQTGGIQIYNSRGVKTGEELTPTALGNLLDKIDSCPDEDCETPRKNCHVSVIIESCYAGKFNVPGVTGPGRAVTGSSTDTPAQGIYPGGGVYTAGFANDLQDPDADTDDPPDGVDPAEAHASADAAVKARKTGQETWEDNQWCECKCPCEPGIDGDKWVWDDLFGMWVNEIEALPGQTVRFRLEIENDGECRDITELEMIDFLPGCLEYADEAIIFYNGVEYGSRPPDDINQTVSGLQLVWELDEIEDLAPGDKIAIEYDAVATYPGPNVNVLFSSAHCTYDPSVVVTDEDTATVMVVPPELPVEEVLRAYVHVSAESTWDEWGCDSFFDVFFEVEDLTGGAYGGAYKVTSVILRIDGVVRYNSGSIGEVYHSGSVYGEAGCGQTIHIELIAMNLIGLEAIATKTITTPAPPD